ncbi:MAG: hypothetical protein VW708_08100, partial [Ilumatobacter sp.]
TMSRAGILIAIITLAALTLAPLPVLAQSLLQQAERPTFDRASVNTAPWPSVSGVAGDPDLIDPVLEVLARVRRAKTEAKVGQRAAVDLLSVSLPEEVASSFDAGRADLADAGSISEIETAAGATLEVSVRLADGE